MHYVERNPKLKVATYWKQERFLRYCRAEPFFNSIMFLYFKCIVLLHVYDFITECNMVYNILAMEQNILIIYCD